jgi:hypothetical protein
VRKALQGDKASRVRKAQLGFKVYKVLLVPRDPPGYKVLLVYKGQLDFKGELDFKARNPILLKPHWICSVS